LASGTDFASVVEKLVAIESRTITRQETWKAEWESKLTAITALNSRLVSLKLDAESKDIRSELLSRAASVSDEKIMKAVNTSTAPLGSYDVEVGQNIQEKLASRSFLPSEQTFGSLAQTITIKMGDDPANALTLTCVARPGTYTPPAAGEFYEGSTLEEIKEAINVTAQAASPAVTVKASVLNDKKRMDGATEVTSQRLVLTATVGGAANKITVEEDASLNFGHTYIDDPVYTSYLGSNAVVKIANKNAYSGQVNKSVTFAAVNSGTLGIDDIVLNWADTEGHSGKITITAQEYRDNPTKEFDIIQDLKISFAGPDADGDGVEDSAGRFIQYESFTIDCQAPTLQKGQDGGLAQTAKVVHSGVSDQISPIHIGSTAGTFTYKYQGVEHSITVTDRMSLGTLANLINEASDNPGVTASIVNDGQGTSTSYHLVLTGSHTGAESAIEIVDTSSTSRITGFSTDKLSFTIAREATNAMIKVDGFPAGEDNWVQRNNNEIGDVIEGAVITLTGVGKSTLTVSNDPTAMAQKIAQLVESINFCKTYIVENTKWGESNLEVSTTETGEVVTSRQNANGIMIGNYGFQISQTFLDGFMNTSIVPFAQDPSLTTKEKYDKRVQFCEENGLLYTTLSEIGITSDPENQGLYKVEQNKLLEAIQKNPEAVIKLFTFEGSFLDKDAQGKTITVEVSGTAKKIALETAKLTSENDITDKNGNVIQQGKGIMITLQQNYQSIIENINAKIAREERRIEAVRQRLTDRFNRLETALQTLQDKQSQLESSISSLSSNSSE
jgi:flagellar hook-associated protein 2